MNILLPRFLRSAYRQDPIPSFLITMGVADVALGGLSSHGGLLMLGLAIVGGALGLKITQSLRRSEVLPDSVVQQYLPAQSSSAELPMLSMTKKKPPH